MTQPPLALTQPPQPPAFLNSSVSAGCQVRCAGCRMILTVGPGLTEFVCPTCKLPQMLPPELMRPPPSSQVPAHGIDPSKIQLPCANCKAILNVPHGLSRFACPQCKTELAVDLSRIKQFYPPPPQPQPQPPPPEEVNEVILVIPFIDYRAFVESICPYLLT